MTLNLLGANRRRKHRAAVRAWRARNVEYEREYRKQYHAANRDARNADCRARYWKDPEKARERVCEYYHENREACLERNRQWVKDNPLARRAIKRRRYAAIGREARFTQAEFDKMAEMQDGLCFWTGDPLDDTVQIDHVVPVSRGGRHGMENLVLCNRYANLAKRAKMPDEFWNWLWPDYPV